MQFISVQYFANPYLYYFNVLLSGCVKGRTDQEGFLEQQKHSCPNYSLQKKKNTDFSPVRNE